MTVAKVKTYRIHNEFGIRMGRAYATMDKAVAALKKLSTGGTVRQLYGPVVAAKNDARSQVVTIDGLLGGDRNYHHRRVDEYTGGNPYPKPC